MTIGIVTYNCAKLPQNSSQITAIFDEILSSSSSRCEYLALALQEVAPIHSACLGLIDPYIKSFTSSAPSDYRFLAKSVCGATVLLVFSQISAIQPKEIVTEHTSFGMLWSSLKGAAMVSLIFDNSSRLTLVSTHLAAGQEKIPQRNEDFRLFYEAFRIAEIPGQLIIAGDLNYRTIDGNFSSDQLKEQMSRGRVAEGLSEGEVAFEPTYKYRFNSDELVQNRVPSYCDRILYRPINGTMVVQYRSIETLNSDHRPVILSLESSLRVLSSAQNTMQPMQMTHSAAMRLVMSYLADLGIGSLSFLACTRVGRVCLVLCTVGFAAYLFCSK